MGSVLDFLQQHDEAFRSQPRLASLYSDFSQRRETNPDGYAANTNAWLRALDTATRHGLLPNVAAGTQHSNLTITYGEPLAQALQSPSWGQPLSLGAVVQDGVSQRRLVSMKDFMNAKKSLYAKSWGPSPYKVVAWGLRQVGLMGDEGHGTIAFGNFVSVANLEAAARAINDHIAKRDSSYTSRVMSRKTFESEVSSVLGSSPDFADTTTLSPSDSITLLTYLSRDKPVLSHDDKTVKLNAPNSSSPDPVTQQDTTIAHLRDLITSLDTQCDALNARIADLNTKIKSALAKNQSESAKSCLRTRKLVETTLQTRLETLHKLESVFTSIENAAGQVEVLKAMEASSSVLAKLNSEVGGAQRVEGVLELLSGQMDDVKDVESVLHDAAAESGAVEDEDELERELDALAEIKQDMATRDKQVDADLGKTGSVHDTGMNTARQAILEETATSGTKVSQADQLAQERDAEEDLERRLAALSLPPSGIRDHTPDKQAA